MERGWLNTFLVLFELKCLGDPKVALGLLKILNIFWNCEVTLILNILKSNFDYQNRIWMIGFLPYIFEVGHNINWYILNKG